jgi:hypothetical protein
MSRPPRIPDRGDVSPGLVAQRLGITLPDFECCRASLERRGFPGPDPTTGRYCRRPWIDGACDASPACFQRTTASLAVDARVVAEERLRAMERGGDG